MKADTFCHTLSGRGNRKTKKRHISELYEIRKSHFTQMSHETFRKREKSERPNLQKILTTNKFTER